MGKLEQIKNRTLEILTQQGLSLIEWRLLDNSGIQQIKIVVDKQNGVSLGDCAKVNKSLARFLEETAILKDKFSIEVSSPGLDREFKSIDDYARCIGKKIDLKARQIDGRECKFIGKITGALGERITLKLENNQELTLNLNDIKNAKLEIGWKK